MPALRIPVEVGGERVPCLYMRYRRDGTFVYEAQIRINGKVTRRVLQATDAAHAQTEVEALRNAVSTPGRRSSFAHLPVSQSLTLPTSKLARILVNLASGSGNFVYVVSDGRHLKIGHSAKPRQRIANLQSGSANQLEVLAVVPGGGRLETALHDLFSTHRHRGEWFWASEEIVAFVRALGHRTSDPGNGKVTL